MKKYYRMPWTKELTEYLILWWPHFGTTKISEQLNLTKRQVKAKIDHLKLKMLAKNSRLCIMCKTNFQDKRKYGFYCRDCSLRKRRFSRKIQKKTLEQWMSEFLATIKYRSKEISNVDLEYIIDLWKKQNGKCYYSNIEMIQPQYGKPRSINSASIDRIDSTRGYIKGNIVWCCWTCNMGKSTLSIKQYVSLCSLVANHLQVLIKSGHDNLV